MLSITKKANIKSKAGTNTFRSQKDDDSKVRNLLATGKQIVFSDIENIYQWAPSINAQILAQLIQYTVSKMTKQNHQASIDFILFLYQTPHQQDEFRYHLKNKYKVDPIIFLLALYERRDKPITLKLVSTLVDSYTLSLMLNGQEAIKLWKDYLQKTRIQYQCLEDIQKTLKRLEERTENDTRDKKGGDSFRKVVIPL